MFYESDASLINGIQDLMNIRNDLKEKYIFVLKCGHSFLAFPYIVVFLCFRQVSLRRYSIYTEILIFNNFSISLYFVSVFLSFLFHGRTHIVSLMTRALCFLSFALVLLYIHILLGCFSIPFCSLFHST